MFEVFWVALLTDLATGLGVVPFAFFKRASDRWSGVTTAVASGMMLSASVFALADKALRRGNAVEVIVGMIAGAAFFAGSANLVSTRRWRLGQWNEASSRQSIVVIATMFVHSIPEGVAIGVGYATGEVRFGLLLAIAIAVHNIPEGTAVALPLRANGASLWSCFWYAILTSVPQPIVAVPAYLLISVAQPLLPASLGFAGGAMIFLVVSELLPESFARCSKPATAWGVTTGLVAMLGFTAALGL
ncbi:MAG: ZIP family metal transporter [Acidobacteria bacterium]|nr:ZIP family metal transporter [Acidobacteriota bacterium]